VLALAVAGLGHAYLRRWRRAAGWFGAILLTGIGLASFFAPPSATSVTEFPPEVILPVLALFALSAVDAYRLARRGVRTVASRQTDDGEATRCPNCGKETDPEMAFCQWCAEPLDGSGEE
jgi:uncharacterized paraquat-inducible protein A